MKNDANKPNINITSRKPAQCTQKKKKDIISFLLSEK